MVLYEIAGGFGLVVAIIVVISTFPKKRKVKKNKLTPQVWQMIGVSLFTGVVLGLFSFIGQTLGNIENPITYFISLTIFIGVALLLARVAVQILKTHGNRK